MTNLESKAVFSFVFFQRAAESNIVHNNGLSVSLYRNTVIRHKPDLVSESKEVLPDGHQLESSDPAIRDKNMVGNRQPERQCCQPRYPHLSANT